MKHKRIRFFGIAVCLLIALWGFLTQPPEKFHDTWIIAHRCGGSARAENSIEGILYAVDAGCDACELDVQRTLDGCYIIYHDKTFSRLARMDGSPGEMSLHEIKALRHMSCHGGAASVPTLEEALDTAKGRLSLLIELKGATADQFMADDVVEMLMARDMMGQAMLMAFDYDLVNRIERKYPAVTTGYLCTKAPCAPGYLNCDCLCVKGTTLNDQAVREIHHAGKKVFVWTVNNAQDLDRFLAWNVDGIITDEVALALETRDSIRLTGKSVE